MNLHRSLSEDPVEILVRSSLRGPCLKILQMRCLRRACMKALLECSWEALVSRSCKIIQQQVLLWRSSELLLGVLHEDLGQGLLHVLVGRPCGDPSGMLSEAFGWSCTGPCEKLLTRSRWNLLGVLTWSSTGPYEKILCRSCWNPSREALALRSCVACIWYIGFLPPTLLGVSCRCSLSLFKVCLEYV